MPPGGASRSSNSVKRTADFSATRCFTIAIDGSSNEKYAGAGRDDREMSVIREAAPLSGSAMTAAAKQSNNEKKKKYQRRTERHQKARGELLKDVDVVDDIEKQQNQQASSDGKSSLSSSRTSSVNSLSGAELAGLALSSVLFLGGINSNSSSSSFADGSVKRQFFWRNIVKQFNFTNEHERKLLISLTYGIQWMKMKTLPKAFIQRHREIFYLVRGVWKSGCYQLVH